jgi:hypothetical protein
MPVLEDGRLEGIVLTHDALERLIPDDGQRRFFGSVL